LYKQEFYKEDEMDKRTKIMNRLNEDYKMLEGLGYEVVGVFLVGSQNYELDYDGSDIDTRAMVLPSFEDFVLNKKLVSYTIELPITKEHVDVKDIRLLFENYKKQNCNFLETMFTDYSLVNNKYVDKIQPIFDTKEKIARFDIYKGLNSMAGMSLEKLAAMEKRYPSLVEKIDKFGYDPKQIHHVLRLNDFIKKFISGIDYKKCMIPDNKEFLIEVKKGNIYNLEEAKVVAKQTCKETYAIAKEYMNNNPNTLEDDVEMVNNTMTKVLLDIFKKRFNN